LGVCVDEGSEGWEGWGRQMADGRGRGRGRTGRNVRVASQT
jgi:hypothetical protein